MASNFAFLRKEEALAPVAAAMADAEKALEESPSMCAVRAAKALEAGIRWVFIHDAYPAIPRRESVSRLVRESTFLDILPPMLVPLLRYVMQLANMTAYRGETISRAGAVVALRVLHAYACWMDAAWAETPNSAAFREDLLPRTGRRRVSKEELLTAYRSAEDRVSLPTARRREQATVKMLTERRKSRKNGKGFRFDERLFKRVRERQLLVDGAQAGWVLGNGCFIDYEVSEIPGTQETVTVDSIFFGEDERPLAITELKESGQNLQAGMEKAEAQALLLEKKYVQKPFLFVLRESGYWFSDYSSANAFRPVHGCFSREGLQRRMKLRYTRNPSAHPNIRDDIAGRPYQMTAVWNICEAIRLGERQILAAMPPGSGKTHVAASAVEALRHQNVIGAALFLTDSDELAIQAKRKFRAMLPDWSLVHLTNAPKREEGDAAVVFSTYAQILDAIDDRRTESGARLFDPSHFDIIIIDDSHTSIYKNYIDVLRFFDAIWLGFSSLPPDAAGQTEIYELDGQWKPVFHYTTVRSIADGWTVGWKVIDAAPPGIMDNDVRYAEISEEKRTLLSLEYSDTDVPAIRALESPTVDAWLLDERSIRNMLSNLMERGERTADGELGKTIIFAKNSLHARTISCVFQRMHPDYEVNFMMPLDLQSHGLTDAIDTFAVADASPRVAVSAGVLDTGIDIPEIVNLVFFTKVHSLAKFRQMLGRGERLCPNLYGRGKDKTHCLVMDYGKNFDFFQIDFQHEYAEPV
ncbi:hypothetical protein TAMA11512_17320 [Selenomonas sp. TAMA-11512]|uniref:DEAD/DEAH box helicase family protein n=1 Tax=Selenomonas sp. TAMA-11512 TaxID=3095337 RepID=UPI00308799B8|nr:hypothetical protein TAMA11512_17320 [Selenomonas sp. TAMA-11512]